MSRVGQVAVVRVGGEGAKPVLVRRRLSDGVQDLHVPDVVDEQRLLEADDQALKTKVNNHGSKNKSALTHRLRSCFKTLCTLSEEKSF